jgi:hypothetical protein
MLHNICTDHVIIRSELKRLFVSKMLTIKCRVCGGKTGPFPTVQVVGGVRQVATIRFRVERDPELTREFGPVANTTANIATQNRTQDANL